MEKLKHPQQGSTDRKQSAFATTKEAADFLGLSKAMIHKLIGGNVVPVCRYGRAVRIPWTWLRGQAGE